jgi:S-adenosylmethionine uptake transporter
MSSNLIGALLMMASMFCFTVNDALVKLTDGALPLSQLLTLRGTMATLLILGLCIALGRLRFTLDRRSWTLIGLRCLAEIGAAYFFLTALLHMPLANVTAILQAMPLTITLAAFLFLKEPVGWRRASAIAAGFCGMLLIVRPGAEGFSIWSVYALIAVLCVTARDLVTRRLPASTPSLSVSLLTSLAVTLFFGAASALQPWVAVSTEIWQLLAGSAAFVVGGYFFSIQTMRVGEVSFVAPFRYTSLLCALILGWLVFGHWPTLQTLLGATIVVAAGLFTLWRERKLAET